jgi:polyisoprenoid-binding protein YceI
MATIKWLLDPAHSEIQFKVKYLMITTVTGSFKEFSAEVETQDENISTGNISFQTFTKSIDTNNEQRDTHLKSVDFFDVEKFPVIHFQSSKFEKIDGDDNFQLSGNLTIKDVTKPIKLNVEFGGVGKDPWGNVKAGFSLNGNINRKDWNLNWNAALESGGPLVSDDVRISCEVQLVKQAS